MKHILCFIFSTSYITVQCFTVHSYYMRKSSSSAAHPTSLIWHGRTPTLSGVLYIQIRLPPLPGDLFHNTCWTPVSNRSSSSPEAYTEKSSSRRNPTARPHARNSLETHSHQAFLFYNVQEREAAVQMYYHLNYTQWIAYCTLHNAGCNKICNRNSGKVHKGSWLARDMTNALYRALAMLEMSKRDLFLVFLHNS